MRSRFRVRSKTGIRIRLLLVSAVLVVFAGLFELYQVLVPFQSANPLWEEVTIGEPVIGAWRYGGQDEEGYLKFYNQGQTVLLPPKAHTFDADGDFVVIEGFTPSSLTFAKPYEALPMKWLAMIALALGAVFALIALRIKRRGKRMKFARRRPVAKAAPKAAPKPRTTVRRPKRFKSTRKHRYFG